MENSPNTQQSSEASGQNPYLVTGGAGSISRSAPDTSAHRPLLPQAPLSISHLIILTACVGIAIQINSFDWDGWSWQSVLQCVDIGAEGFVLSVAALGLIRFARRIISPSAPRYQTLPGHQLAYLAVVILSVKLASEWFVPWLGTLAWSGKMIDAQREMMLLFVIQLLELPAIAWFRSRVKGSLGWHLVALAILIQNASSLLMLALSASYQASGNPWMLSVTGGLGNPIAQIIQWGLVAATILFALVYERCSRSPKVDWLHTASALAFVTWASLYIIVHVLEAMGF